MYGKRIETLCSLLTAAEIFADVGCDHGYCTEYMLKSVDHLIVIEVFCCLRVDSSRLFCDGEIAFQIL